MNRPQRGFISSLLLLGFVALIVIAAVGYYIANNKPTESINQTASNQTAAQSAVAVPFVPVTFDRYCYPFTQAEEFKDFPNAGEPKIASTFVINDSDSYQQLLQYRRTWPEVCSSIQSNEYKKDCYASQACSQVPLPSIDFSRYTLLGQFTSGYCGTTDFTRKLIRDDSKKNYTFTVTPVNTIFACSGPPGASMNWITVPKIPSDYEVLFKN